MSGIINRIIKRAPKEIIDGFRDIPTTIVSDAMNRMNCMSAEIKPLVSDIHTVGSAITVQAMVGCNIMSHKAIYVAEPGDIIVFDARGHKDTSVWGFLQTKACILRKLAGVVIDGTIRDSKEIKESRFPVFCRGVTPAGPHKGWGDSINVDIQCGGVSVSPGDIIIGDDDGVVVVPCEKVEEVLTESKARLQMEKEWFEKLEKGFSTVEILGLDKKITELGVKEVLE